MRTRQGHTDGVMWLELNQGDIRVPFDEVNSETMSNIMLSYKGIMTCSLWDGDARTFKALYEEFITR
jgi:hypothetical protein